MTQLRVGEGWDTHALVPGRKLVIGGIEIPYERGLLGHSDADVLAHAIIDALYGAAGLGDNGRHNPKTDKHNKDTNTKQQHAKTVRRVREQGWQVVNIDSTVIAQAPK